MDSSTRSPLLPGGLRRAAAEFLLILAGVLTALVVDAWWGGRQERIAERVALEELLGETRENERLVQEALDTFVGIRKRTMRLMLAARGSTPLPPDDTLRAWNQMVIPTWTPITGTVRSLIETGQLRILRNSAIRRAIVTVDGRVAAVERRLQDNDMLRQQSTKQRTARMIAYLKPGTVDEGPPNEQETGIGWWRSVRYDALLKDREWQEGFAIFHVTQNNNIRSLQLMQQPLAELRTLVEAELER